MFAEQLLGFVNQTSSNGQSGTSFSGFSMILQYINIIYQHNISSSIATIYIEILYLYTTWSSSRAGRLGGQSIRSRGLAEAPGPAGAFWLGNHRGNLWKSVGKSMGNSMEIDGKIYGNLWKITICENPLFLWAMATMAMWKNRLDDMKHDIELTMQVHYCIITYILCYLAYQYFWWVCLGDWIIRCIQIFVIILFLYRIGCLGLPPTCSDVQPVGLWFVQRLRIPHHDFFWNEDKPLRVPFFGPNIHHAVYPPVTFWPGYWNWP